MFGAGHFRFSGTPVLKKTGVRITGTSYIYWPYQDGGAVYGTVFKPTGGGTFVGDSLLRLPAPELNGGLAVNNCIIDGLTFNGNSQFASGGGDIAGITLEGLTRAHSIRDVMITQTSEHGLCTVSHAPQVPRGGIIEHVTVHSAGNLAGSTQYGFHFDGFTDAKVNTVHAVDCRGGGMYVKAPGHVTGTN